MSVPDDDDLASHRAEHAAGLYALGLLRRDSWVMSEGYLLAALRGRGGNVRIRTMGLLMQALETIVDSLPDDARAVAVESIQHQVARTASLAGALPDDDVVGDDRDPQLTALDEPLRRWLDGD